MSSTTNDPEPDLNRFYIPDDPEITSQIRQIFTQYSGIPDDQVITHIRSIRDKAWAIYKYPCIGLYNFLNFSIGQRPDYNQILARLNSGDTLLDLGCCFGQDIRKLVFDGAPASNLTGSEFQPAFVELGYDLFCDKSKLEAKFTTGDFFAPEMGGVQEGAFDMVHAASFFHLFAWEEQVEAVSRALRLLKQKHGSMLFGRQTCREVAGVQKFAQARSGEMYRHNLESWQKLMEEVKAKTGLAFESKVQLAEKAKKKNVEDAWSMMAFVVTLEPKRVPLSSEHSLKAITT